MTTQELQGMSGEQLEMTLGDTEKEMFQLRFQAATDRLEAPSQMRKAKQNIARIKTELRRRELEALHNADENELRKQWDDLQTKTEGPGKRRAKREIERIEILGEDHGLNFEPASEESATANGKKS